jgi:hypothetical protein
LRRTFPEATGPSEGNRCLTRCFASAQAQAQHQANTHNDTVDAEGFYCSTRRARSLYVLSPRPRPLYGMPGSDECSLTFGVLLVAWPLSKESERFPESATNIVTI